MSSAAHEQVCFACWLRAVGCDNPEVLAAVAAEAFAAGYTAAVARYVPQALWPAATATVPISDAQMNLIAAHVREAFSVPVSPDVAAAMRGDGHGH